MPAMPTEAKGGGAGDVDELEVRDAALLWTPGAGPLGCAEGNGTNAITTATSMMIGMASITARV